MATALSTDELGNERVRGARLALTRLADEIDEDQLYPGVELIVWITGLLNNDAELRDGLQQDADEERASNADAPDVFWAELLRQEHAALTWENPLAVPEWTQRVRANLDRPWTPACCTQCAGGPERYHRDTDSWPTLYGWLPETAEAPR